MGKNEDEKVAFTFVPKPFHIWQKGGMAEMVYEPDKETSYFLISAGDVNSLTELEQRESISISERQVIIPIEPDDSLITNGFVRFPSGLLEFGSVRKLYEQIENYIKKYVILPRLALEKADTDILDHIAEIGKLLKKPSLTYRKAFEGGRRNLIKSLVENLTWAELENHLGENQERQKSIVVVWKKDFQPVADRNRLNSGGPRENRTPASAMRMPRNATLLWAQVDLGFKIYCIILAHCDIVVKPLDIFKYK